jgi:hypothetical protein
MPPLPPCREAFLARPGRDGNARLDAPLSPRERENPLPLRERVVGEADRERGLRRSSWRR